MRITPACAGKTLLCIYQNQYESDHPRVCGENAFFRTVAILQRGSPPRVRGKHIDRATKLLGERITPACAGKTCTISLNPPAVRITPARAGKTLLYDEDELRR